MLSRTCSRSSTPLVAATVAVVLVSVSCGTPRAENRTSMHEFLPIDGFATYAVVKAMVLDAKPSGRAHVQRLELEVDTVHWHADRVRLVDGEWHRVPEIPRNARLTVTAWTDHVYAEGQSHYLFMNRSTTEATDRGWFSGFALSVDGQRPLDGVNPRTSAELHAILAEDERPGVDTVRALRELIVERHAVLNARNGGLAPPAPGPRTTRLQSFRNLAG